MRTAVFVALLMTCGAAKAESIPLSRDNGTFVVPASINNSITIKFTIDSGATDVSIPEDVVSTLLRTGSISRADFLDTQAYQLADGSTQMSRRFRLRSLRVGSVELHDVIASVAPSAGTPLLGQSFLSRLSSWTFDNRRGILTMNEPTSKAATGGDPSAGSPNTVNSKPQAATGTSNTSTSAAPVTTEAPQTSYREIPSRWPLKGVTVLMDMSHVTRDWGNVRRTWVWFMLGPDAKQPWNTPIPMSSYRFLIAYDCANHQMRVESEVNAYDNNTEVTLQTKELPKRDRSWSQVAMVDANYYALEDYNANEFRAICSN